jgi:hypothetical protein
MLMYSPLSAYFDDVIPHQPALNNDGKQRQPGLGDFTSPITSSRRFISLLSFIQYKHHHHHQRYITRKP